MTREEAIAFLESVSPVLSAKMQLAIKTLEQEPVIDKIKAEIESKLVDYVYEEDSIYNGGLNKAIEIIDKYKAESKGQMKTYGYCVYHRIECDYKGRCTHCPHNSKEDTEWFMKDEQITEGEC